MGQSCLLHSAVHDHGDEPRVLRRLQVVGVMVMFDHLRARDLKEEYSSRKITDERLSTIFGVKTLRRIKIFCLEL